MDLCSFKKTNFINRKTPLFLSFSVHISSFSLGFSFFPPIHHHFRFVVSHFRPFINVICSVADGSCVGDSHSTAVFFHGCSRQQLLLGFRHNVGRTTGERAKVGGLWMNGRLRAATAEDEERRWSRLRRGE
ncbi:hypothetical protein U1Q18_029358 [Sarracenia purpurea var. burkii]